MSIVDPQSFGSEIDVMQHALRLAGRGVGFVEPNPAVGAVIVSTDLQLISEGYHERFGKPHAEINAIQQAGDRCRGADLYVTLEPCSHFGKTPPCAHAVAAAGFRRVIIGCQDPASHVAGRGIQFLREHGVEVLVGVCEAEARRLIAPFEMFHCHHRPWVQAKWAMTLDGKIASASGHSQWISCEASRRVVHELRGRMDAIVTGAGTVRLDNPRLTARPPGPRNPIRAIIDPSGTSLKHDSLLVQTQQEGPIIVFVSGLAKPETRLLLDRLGVMVVAIDDIEGDIPPQRILHELAQRQCTNVLLEAGGRLLGSFFDASLIDEVSVFVAPKLVGGKTAPSPIGGAGLFRIPTLPNMSNFRCQQVGDDVLIRGDVIRSSPLTNDVVLRTT